MPQTFRRIASLILLFITAACATPTPTVGDQSTKLATTFDPVSGLTLPAGIRAGRCADGLHLPTHIALGSDGALYLTQLNGGENEGKGQVVRVKAPGTAPEVVIDNLIKPTGLTWADGKLYIVSGNNILISNVHEGKFEPPQQLF